MNPFLLFGVFLKVKVFHWKEALHMRRRYPGFAPYARTFARAYRFRNPYRICRSYLTQQKVNEPDPYGETPLPVLAEIAAACDWNRTDTVLELGCGRGKGAFFLSYLTGCRTIGVDWVPFFVKKAQRIADGVCPKLPVAFHCQSMQQADFSQATGVYLYGTCLSDEEIYALIEKCKALPPGAKIVTVSYPLSDYSPTFQTIKQFTAVFPWGQAEIYLQSKLQNSIQT